MKKYIFLTAVTIASSSAMAALTGDVQFFGNISAATCDVILKVDGSDKNLVQLGTVTTTGAESGTPIPFSLKAKNATEAGCAALGTTKNATVSWDGPLNGVGLTNQGGLATDAVILLKTVNAATTAEQAITSANNSTEFVENLVNSDGYKFTAQLKRGVVPGDFRSTATFAVTYK